MKKILVVSLLAFSFTTAVSAFTFPQNLKPGSRGEDVKNLQILLNQDPDTQIATTGAGSRGNETTYFGPATTRAVIKFQNKYKQETLTPAGLTTGTGFVGALTRKKLTSMGGSTVTETTTPTTTPCLAKYDPKTGKPCIPTGTTISAVFTKSLTLGMRDPDVTRLQTLLATDSTLYPEGTISGYYGALTQKAVKRFQDHYALLTPAQKLTSSYGSVLEKTTTAQQLEKVFGNTQTGGTTSTTLFSRTLTPGMTGDDVKKLQTLLSMDGSIYPNRTISGTYDLPTVNAVKKFQDRYNLLTLVEKKTVSYGSVGTTTSAKLLSLYGDIQTGSTGISTNTNTVTTTGTTTTATAVSPAPVYSGGGGGGGGGGQQTQSSTPTPVNGGWSPYGTCSVVSCGLTGTSTRTCTNPAPSNGGTGCSGASTEICPAVACGVNTFNITASAGANGAISPTGVTSVEEGTNQTYTITPNANYQIATITVDDTATTTNPITFSNVQADHTISATFSLIPITTYTLSVTSNGNGTVSSSPAGISSCGTTCSHAFNSGTSVTLTANANTGYTFAGWGGACTNSEITCVTTMSVARSVTASFSPVSATTYTITASAGTNGTISPTGVTTVNQGTNQTYTITPSSGYQLATLTVGGGPVTPVSSYTFTNVQGNTTISATFTTATPPAVGDTSVAGRLSATLADIASVQATWAAEPMRTGTVHYYCDCGTGASASCVPGSNANSGLTTSAPKQTIADAVATLNSMPSGDTVAMCKGGAFNALNGYNITRSTCVAGTTCVDLREYTPTTFTATTKPVINHVTAGSYLFSFNGNRGGVRILNLKLIGDNGAIGNRNGAMFFYNGAHDVEVGNLDINDFDLAVYNAGGNSGVVATTNIKLTGNNFANSRTMSFLGSGINADLSNNLFENSGSSDTLDHAIYLASSVLVSNIKIEGNYVRGQYGPTCIGSPIVAHIAVDGLLVKDNVVNIDSASTTVGCWGIGFTNMTSDTAPLYHLNAKFSGNTVINGGSRALTVTTCPDCIIENNLILNNWSYIYEIIGISMPSRTARAQDNVNTRNIVRNNTVWFGPNVTNGGIGIVMGTEGDGHVVANNSVYYGATSGGSQGVDCYSYSLPLASYSFINNNHCYSAAPYSWEATRGSLAAWRTYSSAQGFDTASFTDNPLFVAAGTDFTPTASSPLLSAGSAVYKAVLDIFGRTRTNPPAIGAVEGL